MNVIHISGRRWFERTNGNTYHTARTYIDGEPGPAVPFSYGYGGHYLTTATEALKAAGHLGDMMHGESLHQYCDRTGVKLTTEVADVQRKRDL